MPLVRYFVFAGGLLVLGFMAFNFMVPSSPQAAPSAVAAPAESSLAAWRAAESRKAGRAPGAAIVMPSIAPLAPTDERLAFERQLAANSITAPAGTDPAAQNASQNIGDARAELADAPARQTSSSAGTARISKRKIASRPELATADRGYGNPDAGGLFGWIFSN